MANVMTPEPRATSNPTIDYPRQNERITSDRYTIRINAPKDAKKAEISINQGPWQACRPAVGFWWFDWSGYQAGEHEIVARVVTPEGRQIGSKSTEFYADLKPQDKLVKA